MKFGGQPTPWSDEQIDGLRCRTVAQMLIEEIGADGPESAEDAAKRAVAVIQRQRARIATLEAEKAERDAQEPVAWVLFDDIFIASKDMSDDPPNLECMKPLYAHQLALRDPTEEECREIMDVYRQLEFSEAKGRAMWQAVREVMTK